MDAAENIDSEKIPSVRSFAPLDLPVGWLGLNLWAVTVAVPALLGGSGLLEGRVLLPLPFLLGGLVFVGSGRARVASRPTGCARRRLLSRALLLVAFPVSLAAGLDLGHGAGGAVGVVAATLGALSLAAFVAGASAAIEGSVPWIPTSASPFGRSAPLVRPPAFVVRRTLVFGLSTAGAFALCVVAPSVDSADSWAAAYGEASGAAATLTAVVGGLLGAFLLGGYIAPTTRAEKRRRPRRAGGRAVLYGLVALAGLALLALF